MIIWIRGSFIHSSANILEVSRAEERIFSGAFLQGWDFLWYRGGFGVGSH